MIDYVIFPVIIFSKVEKIEPKNRTKTDHLFSIRLKAKSSDGTTPILAQTWVSISSDENYLKNTHDSALFVSKLEEK